MVLSSFAELCSHPHNLILDYLITSDRNPLSSHSPFSPRPPRAAERGSAFSCWHCSATGLQGVRPEPQVAAGMAPPLYQAFSKQNLRITVIPSNSL